MSYVPITAWLLLLMALITSAYLVLSLSMLISEHVVPSFAVLTNTSTEGYANSSSDDSWYPPKSNQINNLTTTINGNDVYGFIFNNSYAIAGNLYYGGYNWCNMPHVTEQNYVRPEEEYMLEYVEVVRSPELNSDFAG